MAWSCRASKRCLSRPLTIFTPCWTEAPPSASKAQHSYCKSDRVCLDLEDACSCLSPCHALDIEKAS